MEVVHPTRGLHRSFHTFLIKKMPEYYKWPNSPNACFSGDPFRASSTNLFCSEGDDANTVAVRRETNPDSRVS
jgi:hypothetical protein